MITLRGGSMALKQTRLARAERLSEEIRKEYKLPEKGLVIIESRNPELKENFRAITEGDNGGIRGYLLTLGEFKDVSID